MAAVSDRLGNTGSCGGESGDAGSDDGEGSGGGRWLGRRRKAPRWRIRRWGGLRRRKTARATAAGSAATVDAITRRIASLRDRSSVAEMEVRAEAAAAIVVANGVFSGGKRRPSHPSLIPSTKQKKLGSFYSINQTRK
uniref:Uncharacterized protein n=1 Tax=Oryza rufipogon TaxID=4529 RepID=A0A0E0N4B8_ORYRU